MAKTMMQEVRGLGKSTMGLIGVSVGLFTMGHGLIAGYKRMAGDPKRIPAAILYEYTGVTESGTLDSVQLIKSATIIGVGALSAFVLKKIAKRY